MQQQYVRPVVVCTARALHGAADAHRASATRLQVYAQQMLMPGKLGEQLAAVAILPLRRGRARFARNEQNIREREEAEAARLAAELEQARSVIEAGAAASAHAEL